MARRLNEIGMAWRNYLYANDAGIHNDAKNFMIRLDLIGSSHDQILETMLEDAPDMELVKACKEEIKFQREQLEEMIGEFVDYCKDNCSVDIILKDTCRTDAADDILNDICTKGTNGYFYVIAEEWKEWDKNIQEIYESLSEKSNSDISDIHDDLFESFMQLIYVKFYGGTKDFGQSRGKEQIMKMVVSDKVVSLTECPIGLFLVVDSEELCVKTEYGNNNGGIDCYIVSSGEFLSCDGKTGNFSGCETILVKPVNIEFSKM